MAVADRQRLAVFSAGFWRQHHHRRILGLSGWDVAPFAAPRRADAVGVWGCKPASLRGRAVAALFGKPVLTVEDAFLRSAHAGTKAPAPVGLLLDTAGAYFDASRPSDLENLLNHNTPVSDHDLSRARGGREFLSAHGLSKYNPVPRGFGNLPEPGYVLVIDQRRGDASIRAGGATAATFREMLEVAVAQNPGREILIRTHPHGNKGHFGRGVNQPGVTVFRDKSNPWDMLDGAAAVYCVTSQLGFEAILAGHRPHVFGLPFYAGWGLSEDRQPCARRVQTLSVDALFAGVMLHYPTWYDPVADTLCDFEQAAKVLLDHLQTVWKFSRPVVCTGFRRWKRPHMRRFLQGSAVPPVFEANPDKALDRASDGSRQMMVWAAQEPAGLASKASAKGVSVIRVEDGFLRSAGLGADLRPPVSLVFDDLGIHYDPAQPSRLEALIASAAGLPPEALSRAAQLRKLIVAKGVTKYNLANGRRAGFDASGRRVVLVVGQVEDDASVRHVAPALGGNAGLLAAARAARPDACILFKPHPDVEAGLRPGRISGGDLGQFADHTVRNAGAAAAIQQADEIWTMSSLLGFEALLRGRKVVCLGMPFYAGWGLTEDRGMRCHRREAKPSLAALVHAALIRYPVYLDPRSGLFTTPENAVAALAGQSGGAMGKTARVQRRFAPLARLWRGGNRRPFAKDVTADHPGRNQFKPGHVGQMFRPESGE